MSRAAMLATASVLRYIESDVAFGALAPFRSQLIWANYLAVGTQFFLRVIFCVTFAIYVLVYMSDSLVGSTFVPANYFYGDTFMPNIHYSAFQI